VAVETDTKPATPLEAARDYVRRGWSVVPVPFKQKRPVLKEWKQLRLAESDLAQYFDQPANIGLILGEPSGWLVDIDLDCVEARAIASNYLPATSAKSGRTGAPGSHWWYIAEGAKTVQHRDPVTKQMIVELRSTGGQTVVGPSIHPTGQPYDVLSGKPAVVSAEELTACVDRLAKQVVELRHGKQPPEPVRNPNTQAVVRHRADSPTDVERRALAYLDKLPPAISGNGGHAATYTAATVLVHGFEIEPERALDMLVQHYNPRCEPPWTEKELRHKVTSAAKKPHSQPLGWLLNESRKQPGDTGVDITSLVGKAVTATKPPSIEVVEDDEESTESLPGDPGAVPDEMLRIPGFISEVMDLSLRAAPYPNVPLAFCGALALQAFFGGRKVRDPADNRTNLYLIGLAYASSGKEFPRKVNAATMHAVGLAHCLGESFASGEGLQDSLNDDPCMLFQTDEIDGLLQSINKSRDARYEIVLGTLLKMYSTANGFYPMRKKAGKQRAETIEQPCLIIYGTAIPNEYYSALSERMLTNGFFARSIIIDGTERGDGQEPEDCTPTPRILETAQYWANFNPGKGNLQKFYPTPKIVPYTDDAKALLIDARKACEVEYKLAERAGDPVGTTVWGRTSEHIRKLALIYSISVNHREPSIDVDAANWATRFMMHQTRRMLFMAQGHVAANPFHAECLKVKEKLRKAPDRSITHQVLLKRMKLEALMFQKIIETLRQSGEIDVVTIKTATKSGVGYRLLS
jgi:Bifunctional DNA primase/polymerase, N-terminal